MDYNKKPYAVSLKTARLRFAPHKILIFKGLDFYPINGLDHLELLPDFVREKIKRCRVFPGVKCTDKSPDSEIKYEYALVVQGMNGEMVEVTAGQYIVINLSNESVAVIDENLFKCLFREI